MADINERNPKNIPGPFFVDTSCIDCDLCRTIAPEVFHRDEESGMTVVHHQPVNEREIADAREAIESCPTESIGEDASDPTPSRSAA